MALKQIICRSHGGTFTVTAKRGRPPVRCTMSTPCTKADDPVSALKTIKDESGQVTGIQGPKPRSKPAHEIQGESIAVITGFRPQNGSERSKSHMRMIAEQRAEKLEAKRLARPQQRLTGADLVQHTVLTLRAYARLHGYSAITKLESHAELVRELLAQQDSERRAQRATHHSEISTAIPSVPDRDHISASAEKAREAILRLESLGWKTHKRIDGDAVEITAARGEELLVLRWAAGKLESQNYSLWNCDQPQKNDKPAHKLNFDPSEIGDRELVRWLAGMKVTWWNSLAKATECAIIPDHNIRIEHVYSGIGDETPDDRIIKFVDRSHGGFRAFRMGSLITIG